jgi:hypothetical protein
MGTTTFFLRLNDCGKPLHKMSKKELRELNSTTPYDDKPYKDGWLVPLELHNGNVNVLVFWKGRLIKIEVAPKVLNKKYYDKYRGKKCNEYEWTMLKRHLLAEVEHLDKEFKKDQRQNKKNAQKGTDEVKRGNKT